MDKFLSNKWLIRAAVLMILIIGAFLAFHLFIDSKNVKNMIYSKNKLISDRIDSLANQYDKLTRSNLSGQEILKIREEVYNYKTAIQKIQNDQNETIENLFLKNWANWSWIFGVFAALLVLTGLDFNIGKKINSIIESSINKRIKHLEDVLNSEVWLKDLRESTNMLVVSKQFNSKGDLDGGVKQMLNLTKLKYEIKNIETLNYELIINDLKNKTAVFIEHANSGTEVTWDNSDVKNKLPIFAEKLTDLGLVVFYFNSSINVIDLVRLPNLINNNYLTSFANTESNIYPNLKNLLIVQKLLFNQGKLKFIS